MKPFGSNNWRVLYYNLSIVKSILLFGNSETYVPNAAEFYVDKVKNQVTLNFAGNNYKIVHGKNIEN